MVDGYIIIVVGKRGKGKSSYTKLFTEKHSRLFIFDRKREYPNIYWSTIEEIKSDQLYKENFFRLGISEPEEMNELARLSFETGNNLLVVEECSIVFEKGTRRLPKYINEIIFVGRDRNCSCMLISQRATFIPVDCRSQASRIICFNQYEPTDLEWLSASFDKETIKKIPNLKRFECFEKIDENEEVLHYSIEADYQDYLKRNKQGTITPENKEQEIKTPERQKLDIEILSMLE